MPRLSAEHRRAQILHKTLELAKEGNLYDVTVVDVSGALDISHATILHHFKSAIGMRKEALILAIDEQHYHEVIAQAIVAKDPVVSGFSKNEKEIYLKAIL